MNLFVDALAWLFSLDRLIGGNSIPQRVLEHAGYTVLSLIVSAVIAIPVGFAIGHFRRGREVTVALSGAARALPSLGLLTVLALMLGLGAAPAVAVIVFVVLGTPSVLAGAYSGIESVDPATVKAARAMGMTEWQVLWKVEVPLGLPLLVGGLRSAALQIVATATLAAYIGLGGLGSYIFTAIPLRQYDVMLGGAILIMVLAIVIDALFAGLGRLVTPRGVRHRRRESERSLALSARPARGTTL
ncbi:MAG: ABC transporter permease [Cryobacterium sp.]|nr:ABC transporter permease [Cryobacterium sp.]